MDIKLDEKIIEAAATAPRVFVDASLGEGKEFNREPGIQLTKDQIISLRKYEELGLSLPVRLQDVIIYLKYGAGDPGSPGLAAKDFLRTFSITYNHARRWRPIRDEIKLTGTQLELFADTILRLGQEIVQVYDYNPVSKYLNEYNIKTPEDYQKLKLQIPDLPGLELDPHDVYDVKYFLGQLLKSVRECHSKAVWVREALDSFGTDMRQVVLPEIKLRLKFVSENTYEAEVKGLQAEIDSRASEIDQLNKRYEALVQEAIAAAATFNIGGLILGIYQGVKAEKVRNERNELEKQQDVAIKSMASKNQTLGSLNRVRGDLQNLSYVAIEAEVATQNLMLVWNALTLYVDSSLREIDGVESATSLRRFIANIRGVVAPWSDIKTRANHLLSVFAEANAEYEQNNPVLRSKRIMISGFSAPRYTPYNIVDLRSLNMAVQDASIRAQMLSEKYDYLPGVVGAMKSLDVAINDSAFAMRKHAQRGSFNLDQAAGSLKGYQMELANPDDVDEVRDDMERKLQEAFKTLADQTEDLKGIKAGMSGRFDRAASAHWTATLEQDRASAEYLKIGTEAKIAALKSEMKSVSEAIDLIGKAGIEKIGKEAQLTFDNLQALGMAPPQVQVALLALDTLKKLVAGIGDVISYLNMLDGFDRLRKKANVLKTQLDSHNRAITQSTGKIDMVTELDRMDDARWKYVNGFETIVNAFAKFSREFQQDKSVPVEERVNTALARIPVIIDYLRPIELN